MNVVLKNIDEKIRKNKLTKIQKKLLKNTEKFYKKFQCKIIYKKIDFINVKIQRKNTQILEIEENITKVYPYVEILGNFKVQLELI